MNEPVPKSSQSEDPRSSEGQSRKVWSKRDTVVAMIAAFLTTLIDQLHNISSLFQ